MTGLSDSEKDEMKALQDKRKATEGHMTDSERLRLSELQGKVGTTTAATGAGAGTVKK